MIQSYPTLPWIVVLAMEFHGGVRIENFEKLTCVFKV